MRRREFIGLVGAAVAAGSVGARAQQASMPVVGVLGAASPNQFTDRAFAQGLSESGYVDGQNVRIVYRWAHGAYERLPTMAAELVDMRVAVLVTFGSPVAGVAKSASSKVTPAIPVVFALGIDPVAGGLVSSLNHPGGNMTGVTSIAGALTPKRIDLMREFLRNNVIAILINPNNVLSQTERQEFEAAARANGHRTEVLSARNEDEINLAFAVMKQRGVDALIVGVDTFFYARMGLLGKSAAQHGIPAMGPLREFAVDGGLMSYGTSIAEANRQAGVYAGKVLAGARPADLPILQPTKFELVINLKAAKALRLGISSRLLALADEVIE